MILLTETKDGRKCYHELGNTFHLIEEEVSPDEFVKAMQHRGGKQGSCFGIIICFDGKESIVLYSSMGNALLNPDGTVFKELNSICVPAKQNEESRDNSNVNPIFQNILNDFVK